MVHLITGYAGKPHVTSSSDGAVNMGMYGKGKYILDIGEKFGYEIISNNVIKIKSGYAINQGRKIEIAINDYEEVTIDNGLQGMKRCDLIVLRYEKSSDSGIETASLVAIKGISGDAYVAPTYSDGDILAGEGIDDFPLYKVFISGISIEKVETQFTVTKSIMEILDEYEKLSSKLEEHELALRQLNTESQNIPTLNGESRKIKVCTGSVLVQFDSTGNAQIALTETFTKGIPVVNFVSSDALLANTALINNILNVQVYPEFANTQTYIKYIVVGY